MNNDNTPKDQPPPPAVADQLDRPVRPSLSEALDAYWRAAYNEGREGREHDTADGAAQHALAEIMGCISADVAAMTLEASMVTRADERERWAAVCDANASSKRALYAKTESDDDRGAAEMAEWLAGCIRGA